MATIRSLYNFRQFRQVFQKLAHEKAVEAVTSLKSRRLLIKSYTTGVLSEVRTGKHVIRFHPDHIRYIYDPSGNYNYNHPDYIDIDIQEKYYSTSPHCTKISFYSPEIFDHETLEVDQKKTDEERKKRQRKIEAFIEKLMKEAGLTPIPRFSLKEYSKKA